MASSPKVRGHADCLHSLTWQTCSADSAGGSVEMWCCCHGDAGRASRMMFAHFSQISFLHFQLSKIDSFWSSNSVKTHSDQSSVCSCNIFSYRGKQQVGDPNSTKRVVEGPTPYVHIWRVRSENVWEGVLARCSFLIQLLAVVYVPQMLAWGYKPMWALSDGEGALNRISNQLLCFKYVLKTRHFDFG